MTHDRREPLKRIPLWLKVLAGVAIAVALWWLPTATRWIAIDRCLDLGGRWDYAAERCER